MACPEKARCRGESRSGFPSTLDFFFCQLKRKSRKFSGKSAARRARRPVFSLCAIFKGTPFLNRANSLFRQRRGEKAKEWVCLFRGGPRLSRQASACAILRFEGSALVVARRLLPNGPQRQPVRLGASAPSLPKKFFDTFWRFCKGGSPY